MTADELLQKLLQRIVDSKLWEVSVQDSLTRMAVRKNCPLFCKFEHISYTDNDDGSTMTSIFKIDDTYFSVLTETDSYGDDSYAIVESLKVVKPATKTVTTFE